jgi:hypothetical protein
MKRFWLVLATLGGLTAAAVPASADVTYQLTCKTDPCGAAVNYGKIVLHQNGSAVTVTVDLTTASSPETFAGSGAGYTVAWNIVGSSPFPAETVSLTSATGTVVGNDIGNYQAQNEDPNSAGYKRYKASPFTGGSCGATTASCFMYAIDTTLNGSNSTDNKLVFDVTKSGGLLVSDFQQATSNGYYFAVDIFRDSKTFNVAANTFVPEPGTVLMILAGLGGLFMLQRRRKLVRAA